MKNPYITRVNNFTLSILCLSKCFYTRDSFYELFATILKKLMAKFFSCSSLKMMCHLRDSWRLMDMLED